MSQNKDRVTEMKEADMKYKNIPKIDLHMHSNVSDGSDSPVEIISQVKKAGIDIFALTDHDSTAGCQQIREHLKEGDPIFTNGIEFSCEDELGKYHILGYDYDDEGQAILKTVKKGHDLRMYKVTARLDFLKDEFGFTFSDQDVARLLAHENPGKPHIGNMMVEYGYAPNRDVAIEEYINKRKVPNEHIGPEEAIHSILESGGVPVLAHPFFGSGGELVLGKEMEERLVRLMDMGLQGVEAWYSGFSRKLIGQMLFLADKYQLYVTAGSDYHGSNKLVELGDTNLEPGSPVPEGMIRFLDLLYKKHKKTLQSI